MISEGNGIALSYTFTVKVILLILTEYLWPQQCWKVFCYDDRLVFSCTIPSCEMSLDNLISIFDDTYLIGTVKFNTFDIDR